MRRGLQWLRLDSDWFRHPKFRTLQRRRQWRTIAVYFAALAYSVEQGTDGYVSPEDLPEIWATPREVETLISVGLWDITPDECGWTIHNYAEYQQLSAMTAIRSEAAAKAARARWHGSTT